MARPTTALIVDDEAHVRTFLKLCLKDLGIKTTWEADDGAQGLAMILHHKPDLVLLDINLPVMSGIEVLEQAKRIRPDLPVIMVTVQSAMKTVLDCVRLGATAYVLKHAPKAEALKALREAIDTLDESETAEGEEPGRN